MLSTKPSPDKSPLQIQLHRTRRQKKERIMIHRAHRQNQRLSPEKKFLNKVCVPAMAKTLEIEAMKEQARSVRRRAPPGCQLARLEEQAP